jgi:hypothetical protein
VTLSAVSKILTRNSSYVRSSLIVSSSSGICSYSWGASSCGSFGASKALGGYWPLEVIRAVLCARTIYRVLEVVRIEAKFHNRMRHKKHKNLSNSKSKMTSIK